MAAPRRVVELAFSDENVAELTRIARSRTEPASRVERARMLLAYRESPSFYAVGRSIGVTHQTVERCTRRAQTLGVMAALDDSPRPGREPVITEKARTFVVDLACRRAKDLGYPHELWTTRLLAGHIREHGPKAGHARLPRWFRARCARSLRPRRSSRTRCVTTSNARDPEFEAKMAEVLCVYREVELLKQSGGEQAGEAPAVAIVSYDEKPGVQAIGTTAPDLPPVPRRRPRFSRDHEYVRRGTLSLLAGIDLVTGMVHASVEERHRSREFVAFLRKLDAAYPPETAIKLLLDNHSAHVSKETKAWLAAQPEGRFTFVFTPKHGSWLNLVEGFFSKLARSVLRHIRVKSKQELKERILAAITDINRHPVVHTWTYRLNEAA